MKSLFLLLFLLSWAQIANSQSVVVDGVFQLPSSTNHAGVVVQFDQFAPNVSQQTAITNSLGQISISIPPGLYNVIVKKTGFFSINLGQINCFSNITLPSKTLQTRRSLIRVPDHFAKIQNAIDDALTGDTVLVNPGTYYENIDLKGRKILLSSRYLFTKNYSDIKNTVIDGGNAKSVVVCSSFETENTIISGFTIKNGKASGDYPENFGGGIRCITSSPTLENLIITNNYAQYGGGGIFFSISFSKLKNIKIVDNVAERDGGGIRATSSDIVVRNAIIANNKATNGGGLVCTYFSQYCRVELINATVTHNSVTSKSTDDNSNFFGGAGIKVTGAELILRNSIVAFNEGDYGISFYNQGIVNGFPKISYSCFFGNTSGNFFKCDPAYGALITKNTNGDDVDAYFNVFKDPIFTPSVDDYTVFNSSPSVDAGYNLYNTLPTDIYNNLRIQNNKQLSQSLINMGAVETTFQDTPEDPVVSSIPDICEGGSATINILSKGSRFKWFLSQTSANSLFETGKNFSIDTLTRSITLFVANADFFPILSKKVAVTIGVLTKPKFEIVMTKLTPSVHKFSVSNPLNIDTYKWIIKNTSFTSNVEKPVFEFERSGVYEVCVEVANRVCKTVNCTNVDFIVLSAEEDMQLRAFPNPVISNLYLTDESGRSFSVSVINSIGQKIMYRERASHHTLLFEKIDSGIYFVVVEYEKSTRVFKLVML